MLQTLITKFTEFDPIVGVAIFIGYILIDAMYASYTFEINRLHEVHAATVGAFIHLLLAFGVLNYIGNFLYVIPLAMGSWVGTYYSVRAERLKSERA